jgi:Holliday junction resolvase RusA-like endonuclease
VIQTFTIPGEPVGKGRPRFGRTKNGGVHTYTPDKTAKYEALAARCYRSAIGYTIKYAPIGVEIDAYFPIPKSYSAKRVQDIAEERELPMKKPDCDNIVKIILDALNGVAYTDDKQVVDVRCRKCYAKPGEPGRVVVTIWSANPVGPKI